MKERSARFAFHSAQAFKLMHGGKKNFYFVIERILEFLAKRKEFYGMERILTIKDEDSYTIQRYPGRFSPHDAMYLHNV